MNQVHNLSLKAKQDQSVLVKTIGKRLKAARELNNMTLSSAAKKFGYKNQSKLSKIENASDTNSVPLWFLSKASQVYDVSMDYLFGLTEEWERGVSTDDLTRIGQNYLVESLQLMQRNHVISIASLHNKINRVGATAVEASKRIKVIVDALETFKVYHVNFETEMKGSNRLSVAVNAAFNAAKSIDSEVNRFRIECASELGNANQIKLFGEE